uniref:PIH1 domain containing 2 n=1 Tax=Cyprinodon variegatus TaxID=28743 RepID=A0A3Q2G399_CYPVA
MSSTGGRHVLQQVSQFWSMLDDLSENDPVAYSRFIEEQMKRGAEFNAPPELHSCVRTQILEPKPGWLYINICSWKRVPKPSSQKTKNDLIQVISSTFQGPQEPEYLLEVKTDAAGVPRSVKLTVDLPKVRSMSECQLRISKEDVVLQVEDVYYLLLEFPKTVNEDTASAVFYKKKRRLTLTADVL